MNAYKQTLENKLEKCLTLNEEISNIIEEDADYESESDIAMETGHSRKVGPSHGTPGPPGPPGPLRPLGPLGPWRTLGPLGPPGAPEPQRPPGPPVLQDPMDPRDPQELWTFGTSGTSGPLANYLYRLKFRI